MYGGTKTEMERLIADAAKLDKSINANDMSFANIVKSINAVQREMGIYGATAAEAASTIEGSLAMTKASWENLLTGMADEEADFETLIDNFVESVGITAENILPRIEIALNGAADLISELLPVIVEKIPPLIESVLPNIASAAVKIVENLISGIGENKDAFFTTVFDTIMLISEAVLEMLPEILKLGLDLIIALANGIAENIPELLPTIISVILEIVEMLTEPETLSSLLNAALEIITQLAYGLMESIPQLVQAVTEIIVSIADFLIDPNNIGILLKTALDVILALGSGFISAIPELLKIVPRVWLSIIDDFRETDWGSLGTDLVAGFKTGIEKAWANLKEWFKGLFGDLVGIAKKILGIASPSKVFKQIGKFVDEGLAIGINQNANIAYSAVGNLAKGVAGGFDVSLGTNYIGTYSGYTNKNVNVSNTDILLTELISMFKNGTATTNVGNTRELRRAVNA